MRAKAGSLAIWSLRAMSVLHLRLEREAHHRKPGLRLPLLLAGQEDDVAEVVREVQATRELAHVLAVHRDALEPHPARLLVEGRDLETARVPVGVEHRERVVAADL